jgi:hypothetical protein
MVLVHLTAALQRLRPFKAPMIVVAVSALLALLFTLATMPSAPEPPRAAGEAAMRLVNAEHDLAAASVRTILAAVAAVDEADARSRAEMRTLAMAEAPRLAMSDMPAAPPAKPGRAAQSATAVSNPPPAIEPPLQLLPVVVARQPDRRGPVAERAQAVMATVERIPQWLRAGAENIADWAVTAPVKTIARLPERRFL